ncbi:MAG: hypothetical protein WBW41_02170 [Verrucomicrobiia bacterium]
MASVVIAVFFIGFIVCVGACKTALIVRVVMHAVGMADFCKSACYQVAMESQLRTSVNDYHAQIGSAQSLLV